MNSYLITFSDGKNVHAFASDTDMAVMRARVVSGNGTRVCSMLLDGIELVAPEPPVELPPRSARGLKLSAEFVDGQWSFRVVRFGYSASLALVSDCGVLNGPDGERTLSDEDMVIIHEWEDYQDEYAANLSKEK